jgi:hypothetical protein
VGLNERLGRAPIASKGLVDDWLQHSILESPKGSLSEICNEVVLVLVASGLESG